MRTAAEW